LLSDLFGGSTWQWRGLSLGDLREEAFLGPVVVHDQAGGLPGRFRVRDWMALEDDFFARDGAQARADYIISGVPTCSYDRAAEVVILQEG
jgi:hypothetical protein